MTTKTKAIIGGAVGGIVLLALLGGGPPSELEVKGLRLGMSVEEAARVMLGHGYEIGGKADPGYNTWASREHGEAQAKHAAAYIREVCAELGFSDIGAYMKFAALESGLPAQAAVDRLARSINEEEREFYEREVLGRMTRFVRAESERLGVRTLAEYINLLMVKAPQEYRYHPDFVRSNYGHRLAVEGELELGVEKWFTRYGKGPEDAYVPMLPDGETLPDILDVLAEAAPDGTLSLANLETLLDDLGDFNNPEAIQMWGRLIPESETFPDLDAYIAEHYPDGRPAHLGGPWDGKSELELEEGLFSAHVFRGGGWGVAADEQRRVEAIELTAAAIDRLFGAEDMGAEEFAASFASAYDVPLEPTAEVVDPDIAMLTGNFLKTGWAFVNREGGWAVNISDAKVLEVRAITPASKQSFD